MVGKQGRAKRGRRQFTDECEAGALRLVFDEGGAIAQVASDSDLTASALVGWVKPASAGRPHEGAAGITTKERAELARLRGETAGLRGSVTS
jgi:transposase-like protein